MSNTRTPIHNINPLKGRPVVLVAGGAGFLGSYLCEKLLLSCDVICLDNLRFGKREKIKTCLLHPRFSFIEHDIAKPIHDLLRKKADYIFHVAGVDDVEREKKASLDTLLLNTYGTRNLLEKSVSDKAKFLLVSTLEHEKTVGESIDSAQARLFSESITEEYIKTFGVDARIVRVGHLFGPRMPLTTQNPMGILVKALLFEKELYLANDELTRIYPVFIEEAVLTILETMFGAKTKGKIYNLIPSRSISLLELSHILETVNSSFTLRFNQEGIAINLFSKEHFEKGTPLSVSPKKELKEEIIETIAYFKKSAVLTKIKAISPMGEKERKLKKRRFLKAALFMGLFLFITFILPFLLIGTTSLIGIAKLNESYQLIEEGKLKNAGDAAHTGQQSFKLAKSFSHFFSYNFFLLGKQKEQEGLFLLLAAGEDAGLVSSQLANAGFFLGEFFQKSVQGQGFSAKPSLDRAIAELNGAALKMPLLERELTAGIIPTLPKEIQAYISGKKEIISKYEETLTLTQTLANLMPDILGFEDKRSYLILFQNNMELRPGGGFIGSYGLVTFEKGSLTSFDVFDVYSADGQLKGHVDPPSAIRKYLSQPNWFLRDSNWDPDFQASATQAAWFLQKEVGTSVHGVIAVDVSFAKLLLEAVGPISLPDYKETVTKDNLFEKVESHVQTDFFPGSTQKTDFLGALNRRIIDRLLHDTNVPWLSVLSASKKGVSQKHLLFSFNNASIQEVFTLNNWGGSLLIAPQKEGNFADFRMLSEANLGVNKANAFVKRKVSDAVTIEKEGTVSGTLSIQYTNDSKDALPGGPYVNYLRVLFPQNTKLTSLAIDGKEATVSGKVKGASGGLDLEEATESGKTVFGFLVTIPAKTSKVIAISYRLSTLFGFLPGSNGYSYIFQKQPGTNEDPLTVMMNYPKNLTIQKTNAQVFQEKESVTLSTDLSEDRLFDLEFLH